MEEIKKTWSMYSLAVLICFLFTINAVFSTIVAAMMNVDNWSTLTPTKQFTTKCVVIYNASTILLAFFNKTMSRIEHGKPPIDTGDTNQFYKDNPPKS